MHASLIHPLLAVSTGGSSLNTGIVVGFILFFVVASIVITWWTSRSSKSAGDFYVAGKSVPWVQVGIAMVGSYLSAASFLGCAGDIGVFGIDSIWLSIGFFGGYMAVLLLIAGPLRNVGSYTVAGALHRRYPDNRIKLAVMICTVVISTFYLVPQMLGAGLLFEMLLGWNFVWVTIALGVLMCIYIIFGGMKATLANQVIQAVFLWIAMVVLTVMAYFIIGKGSFEGILALANETAVNLPCVLVNGMEYSVNLNHYVNMADPFGFYWSLGAVQVSQLGTWYSTTRHLYGICEVKLVQTTAEETFERLWYAKTTTDWVPFMGTRGGRTNNGYFEYLTIQEIFFAQSLDTPGRWFGPLTGTFQELKEHLWGSQDTLLSTITPQGDSIIVREDRNLDGDYEDEFETIRFSREAPDDATISGHGLYPYLEYSGVNFHQQTDRANISVSFMFFLGTGQRVTSVSVDLSGPGGRKIADIPLRYESDQEEWGASPFIFPEPSPATGIWWISRVEAHSSDGSSSVTYAANPYAGFTYDMTSSSGFSENALSGKDTHVGQDYMPATAGNFFYIETFPNGSSAGRTDPELRVFSADDPVHWIAVNDDGGRAELHAGIKIALESGKKYYISVKDPYQNGGTYSILISKTGFVGGSSGTVSLPDAFEPDNTYQSATPLVLDIAQNHSLAKGEQDWFVFTPGS